MKKTTRISVALLLIVFILSTSTTSFCSSGNMDITMDSDAVLISRENQLIYEKIEQISLAKSAVKAYMHRHSLSPEVAEVLNADELNVLRQEIDTLRSELTAMGADIDTETLSELFGSSADTMNDDFDLDEFEALIGNAYDVWGVYQQVNASYGTYYVYDVIVQDTAYSDLLETHVTQNGVPGFEVFYNGNNALLEAIGTRFMDIAFESAVKTIKRELPDYIPIVNTVSVVYKTVRSIIDANNLLTGNLATGSGNTRSYRIYCDVSPTMHLLYVKDSPNGDWYHTFTNNSLTVTEQHDWYFVYMDNGQQTWSDERIYQYMEYTDRNVFRYTDAITMYRNGISFKEDLVESWVIKAVTPEAIADVFELAANCPATRDALYQIAITN